MLRLKVHVPTKIAKNSSIKVTSMINSRFLHGVPGDIATNSQISINLNVLFQIVLRMKQLVHTSGATRTITTWDHCIANIHTAAKLSIKERNNASNQRVASKMKITAPGHTVNWRRKKSTALRNIVPPIQREPSVSSHLHVLLKSIYVLINGAI